MIWVWTRSLTTPRCRLGTRNHPQVGDLLSPMPDMMATHTDLESANAGCPMSNRLFTKHLLPSSGRPHLIFLNRPLCFGVIPN
jgi:hypothetical protein